jgi:zinc protease
MYVAGCETRNDAVLDVIKIMQSLMVEIREQPVSEDELQLAKESIINSFVFAFEDSHDIVERTLNLEMYDYPDDYLQSFREKIAAVTVADVQAAARKYLRPDDMKIVLVGNSREFGAPLSSLGIPLAK